MCACNNLLCLLEDINYTYFKVLEVKIELNRKMDTTEEHANEVKNAAEEFSLHRHKMTEKIKQEKKLDTQVRP